MIKEVFTGKLQVLYDEASSIQIGDTNIEDFIRNNIDLEWKLWDGTSKKKYRVTIEEINDPSND
jgi:hypothetical protein